MIVVVVSSKSHTMRISLIGAAFKFSVTLVIVIVNDQVFINNVDAQLPDLTPITMPIFMLIMQAIDQASQSSKKVKIPVPIEVEKEEKVYVPVPHPHGCYPVPHPHDKTAILGMQCNVVTPSVVKVKVSSARSILSS